MTPMDATEPTAETASPPATTGAPDTLHAAVGEFYRHWSPLLLSGIAGSFVALRIALGGWSLGDLVLVAAIAT